METRYMSVFSVESINLINEKLVLMFKLKHVFLLCCLFVLPSAVYSQVEEETEEEEDYSLYDNFGTDESVKRFCTPKVVGLSPQKLVTIGFDFAGSHRISADSIGAFGAQDGRVRNYMGMTLGANIPVLSNNKILINLGGAYTESRYTMVNDSLSNPLLKSVDRGLKTLQLNTTIFKPLNEKHYLLAFIAGEYSGDYSFKRLQSLNFLRLTWVGVFGWKFNERFQFGIGATQTYRAGGKSFLPVIHYNFTSKNEKWGIEALLPARGHYRYSFNRQTMLLAGFEVLGTSYHLNNADSIYPANSAVGMIPDYNSDKLELRRSEIRLRLDFQRAITSFIWVGVQAGYIINYSYNLDSGNFYRGFGSDRPFVMENSVTSAPYFQVTLNLVSP